MFKYVFYTLLCLSLAVLANAQGNIEVFDFESDADRKRFVQLSEELRCPTCQNQNLWDSNSETSSSMRALVAEKIIGGEDEEEIKSYLVERYGDYVLYSPPVTASTAILWAAPFLIMLIALAVFIKIIRTMNADAVDDLDEDLDEDGLPRDGQN